MKTDVCESELNSYTTTTPLAWPQTFCLIALLVWNFRPVRMFLPEEKEKIAFQM